MEGRTGTMWPLVFRVGEAGAPLVSLFSRYLESGPCQDPRGRYTVRKTRLGCWRRGRKPGTRCDGVRHGLLGAIGGIFRDRARGELGLRDKSGVLILVIWVETGSGALGLH